MFHILEYIFVYIFVCLATNSPLLFARLFLLFLGVLPLVHRGTAITIREPSLLVGLLPRQFLSTSTHLFLKDCAWSSIVRLNLFFELGPELAAVLVP